MPISSKILRPLDFSDDAMAVLDEAAKLARKDDALLYLMQVEFVTMKNPAKLTNYITVSTTRPALARADRS